MDIKNILLAIRINFREKLNPILGPFRRLMLNDKDFTIFSNNCWGGHVYRYFNLPYRTPTVGLYFFSDDYIKFLSRPKYYISQKLSFINIDDSKYREVLKKRHVTCPIGIIGDVEIIFLHYSSIEEAEKKWNRRKERINWDHIVVKMSEQNLCSIDAMKSFDSLKYDNKLLFTTKDYNLASQLVREDYKGCPEVTNDTNYFRTGIKLAKFINGDPFFKK